jgi:membrane fusion protein (multidrug efflux system)
MNATAAASTQQAPFAAFAPPNSAVPRTARRARLPWSRIVAGAAIAAAAAAGIGGTIYRETGFESTDDAYLAGDVHPVSPRISGTVARVLVDDNARVKAGDPLVEIDPADLNLAVLGAEADLAQARASADQAAAETARARAEVDAAAGRIAQNAAELTRAQLDLHRMQFLASDSVRAISRQQLDSYTAAFDSARAARAALLAERAASEAALASAQAQAAVASARIGKAFAALGAARLQVDYTILRAPVSGRVARKDVEAGQRLQPGQPVMAIVEDQVWVVANFKESQLARLRVGQKVDVSVDASSERGFTGTVESFSPGTGAEFSLLPPDNSTGNFTKVVQRVPVKILLSPESLGAGAGRLFPGLSAVVTVAARRS